MFFWNNFQVALCGTQIWWTTEVGISFNRLEEGYENAMKDYYKKQVGLLMLNVKIKLICFFFTYFLFIFINKYF